MIQNRKILFLIQWYPSILSANALCDQKIIEVLAKQNDNKITCLVYKPTGSLSEEIIDNVRVVRFHKGFWWNARTDAKRGIGRFNKTILRLDKALLRIRQIITIPIYPNTEPIASWKFAYKAVKLHKKEHFDIVISEFYGYDSLHAGSNLKKHFPSIKFIPILWDPFTGKEPAKYLPPKYANQKLEIAEKRELECADKIIVMESSRKYHEQHSRNKSYYDRFIFLDIPGIVKPPEATCSSGFIHEGKINIVYAGILSLPDRDPEYIINALAQTSCASDIHMIFICTGEGKEKLKSLKKEFPGEISINSYVEKDELVSVYHGADILLNLGGPNPNMVPSKVFEYVSYGKPVLSTYYIDDEASLQYLKQYPLSVCIDQRKPITESAYKIDLKLWTMIKKNILFDIVCQLFPNNTPDKYKEVIELLL